MSFEILEKSPQVAPLLVRLYDTHNLYSLAGNKDSSSARMELATIMVDLMSVKLSDTEKELITDVMFSLMKQAEKDLKQAVAERLATLDNVPLRMILALANDEITIAASVLRASPLLQDMDLMYILQSKGLEHGRAIAQRKGLGPDLIDILAGTKDFETAINLSNNNGIALTDKAYDILINMAKDDANLAKPLVHRQDLPRAIAIELYDFIGAELKAVVVERFGDMVDDVIEVINDVTEEVKDNTRFIENYDLLMSHARVLQRRGELKFPMMVSSLRRGQLMTFMVQFSVFSTLPLETIRNSLKQDSGKGLAMICRALDSTKADFVSIYLLTERFRNVTSKRVISHAELSRLMNMFDDIEIEDARRVVYGATQ